MDNCRHEEGLEENLCMGEVIPKPMITDNYEILQSLEPVNPYWL